MRPRYSPNDCSIGELAQQQIHRQIRLDREVRRWCSSPKFFSSHGQVSQRHHRPWTGALGCAYKVEHGQEGARAPRRTLTEYTSSRLEQRLEAAGAQVTDSARPSVA